MSRWTVVFAVSTLAFASATGYLAHTLKVEREAAAEAAKRVSVVPEPTVSSTLPAGASPTPSTGSNTEVRNPHWPLSKAELLPAHVARLERLTDPRLSAEVHAAQTKFLHEDLFGIGKHLGLSAAELDRLVDLVVEQNIKRQVATLRCEVDPNCTADPKTLFDEQAAQAEREQLLGKAKAQRYLTYTTYGGERDEVQRFQDRLPAGQELSEEQTDRLIIATAEEKRQFDEEALARGEQVVVFMQIRAAVAKDAKGQVPRLVESATQYSQRLRDRAASILTPAQLVSFNEMQDFAVASAGKSRGY